MPVFNTATLKVGVAAVAAAFIGSQSLMSGAAPFAAPPTSWRLPITAAYDSLADAALVTALIGSETTKARPSYPVAATTRTIAVKVGAVAEPGGIFSYVSAYNGITISAGQSFDSTDGVDGAWTALPANLVAASTGSATVYFGNARQVVRIAAGPARWVSLTITAAGSTTIYPLVHQLQSGAQDAWLTLGASLEASGMRSIDLEAAIIAAYPDRDPLVFMHAISGAVSTEMLSWPATVEAGLGDIYRYVLIGNIIGNDITNSKPISDDAAQSLLDLRARVDTITTGFPGKQVFVCRTTYRQYTGITPEAGAELGALPYNDQIIGPAVLANAPGAYDSSALVPHVDLYAAAMFNRALLSDFVHFGSTPVTYAWMRDEWIRTAVRKIYFGTWQPGFAEFMANRAIAHGVTKTEAQYAVNSLPPSPFKTALDTRLNAAEVPDTPLSTVQINFGTATVVSGWNTSSAYTTNSTIVDLKDPAGVSTGWSMTLTDGGTANTAGTGAQGAAVGAVFPDAVLYDYMSDTSKIIITLSNLTAGTYRLLATASRTGITGKRLVKFSANSGEPVSLDISSNIELYAQLDVLTVTTGGSIVLTITKGESNVTAAYINGLVLRRLT